MAGFLRRLLGGTRADRDEGPSPQQAGYSTEAFRQILSAAKSLQHHHSMDRTAPNFDDNIGFGLAQRYAENRQSEEVMLMTTAVLLSHCSPHAAAIFVAHMKSAGITFGVRESGNYLVPETALARLLTGTMDIYALAADRAAGGDMELLSSPFRGPAHILWEAGYVGTPQSDPKVGQAYADLAAMVRDPWAQPIA